jgi:hypothetical protein
MSQYSQLNEIYNTSSDSDNENNTYIKNIHYNEWINSIAAIVFQKIKMNLQDLPDEDYRNKFEEGITSTTMAKIILNDYL